MSITYDFSGKTLLVTGAGSGIGKRVAERFAEQGAKVAVVGRSESGVDETVELIRRNGGTATPAYGDVADPSTMEAIVAEVIDGWGRLDIAVNCAGVFPPPQALGDLDPSTWAQAIGTNLTGIYTSMRSEIGAMRRNGGGVIVNASSNIGAHSRRPGLGAYVASKAGVSALTAVAALDHIGEGIRINAISPGATATRMSFRKGESEADRAERLKSTVPIGRVAEVDEIVNAILWLASDESSFVVGQDIVVDGGVAV